MSWFYGDRLFLSFDCLNQGVYWNMSGHYDKMRSLGMDVFQMSSFYKSL